MGGPLGAIAQKPTTNTPQRVYSGEQQSVVGDADTRETLKLLLMQAKETNLHLSEMTGKDDLQEELDNDSY